jgi:predicted S18 family serine protease
MKQNSKHSVAGLTASNFTPIQNEDHDLSPDSAEGLDLIDHAAALLRNSEQRAMFAEDKAEKVSAKALEAIKAAQLRIEHTEMRARQVEQHAAQQVQLAQDRIANSEALAQERVEKVERWAHDAEERARAAVASLQAAEVRASDAEERLHHLTDKLRRKLSSPVSPVSSFVMPTARTLN